MRSGLKKTEGLKVCQGYLTWLGSDRGLSALEWESRKYPGDRQAWGRGQLLKTLSQEEQGALGPSRSLSRVGLGQLPSVAQYSSVRTVSGVLLTHSHAHFFFFLHIYLYFEGRVQWEGSTRCLHPTSLQDNGRGKEPKTDLLAA